MGLKSAILGAVVNKTIRTIATQGEVQESKITTTDKKGNIVPAYEYMNKSNQNCFFMESSLFDMYSLKEYKGKESLKYYDYDGRYLIFDKKEYLKYLSLEKRRTAGEELIGKDLDKYYLFDLNGTLIGRVKEHIISMHAPVIEDDSKTYSIFLADSKLCEIRRYYSVGKQRFEINYSDYSLEYKKNNEFLIKKRKKDIAKITIFRPKITDKFRRSIVVEYDNKDNETITILFAMAFDSICSY